MSLPPRPNDITVIAANEARTMRLERRRSSRCVLSPLAARPRGPSTSVPVAYPRSHLESTTPHRELPAGDSGVRRTSPRPLIALGARAPVTASRYVPPVHPPGQWRNRLQAAENEAMRRANAHGPSLPSGRPSTSISHPSAPLSHTDLFSRPVTRTSGSLKRRDPSSGWHSLSREEQIVELTAATTRHAWKNVQIAQRSDNTTRLANFRLEDAVARDYRNGKKVIENVPVEEVRATVLCGSSPHTIFSADHFPLVVYIPRAFRGKTLDDATAAIVEWGRSTKPSPKGSNDFNNCYKHGYELVGRTRLATLWHPIGHKHDPPVVCADICKTGQSYEGAFKLFAELDLVNSFCTTALLAIDPLQYGLLRKVYEWRLSECKSQVAIAALDKYNLWEGREIMFNRWSEPHFDQHDAHYSWACLVYFGDFKEATIKFRQLNLEVRLHPGDVLFMRRRDLLHEVPDWGDGQRHFMVYFTHESLWEAAGVHPRGRSPV